MQWLLQFDTKILANHLKGILDNLIGKQQSGFVLGRTPLDNIIGVQEIIHFINQDKSNPLRMLIKVDVEKAYVILNLNVILATLARIGFPNIWISWIRACLSSTSFFILINGQHSNWFTLFKGVKQEDPIALYLFIIVSQNLLAILNHAKRLNMIPGFKRSLGYDFNHLMYPDDLVLTTSASRKTARNVQLCPSIYAPLIGQKTNPAKSKIYFPN